MRLNRYIASCGVCSRREADRMIEAGRVLVNGEKARQGMLVDEAEDRVVVDGDLLSLPPKRVVLAYYKPVGVTCSERDSHADRLVIDEIDYPVRVTYAGRLDRDSEGLLLLSNDGGLIQDMMKGANAHEREYQVWLDRACDDDFLKAMEAGVYLEELDMTTRPCKAWRVDDKSFRIILTQGVNRQIRRMCAALGHQVVRLKRLRVLQVSLGDLEPGCYRELSDGEIDRDILSILAKAGGLDAYRMA